MRIERRRRKENPLDKAAFVGLLFFVLCLILYYSNMSLKVIMKWALLSAAGIGGVLYLLNKLKHVLKAREERRILREIDASAHEHVRYQILEKQQVEADTKSAQYEEKVVKPREEAKLKMAEEEVKKISRHWKGDGYKLGSLIDEPGEHSHPDENDPPTDSKAPEEEPETTVQVRHRVKRSDSHDAAERRRLGVSQDLLRQMSSSSTSQSKDDTRETGVLANDEHHDDNDGDDDGVQIAMKLPDQQVVHRKFSKVQNIGDLYKWLEELGWNIKEVDLFSTYPREHFDDFELTLVEAGIAGKRFTIVAEYL